jgi:hypothetical protein
MSKEFLQRVATVAVSLFVIVYFVVRVIFSYSNEISYSQAISASYEQSDELSGYILRNEKLVTTDIEGIVYTSIDEGTRIKKGQLLATVYASAGEKNIKERILEIDKSINVLSASQIDTSYLTSNIERIDSDIYDLLSKTRSSVESNSLDSATKNRNDLLISLNKRQIMTKQVKTFEPLIEALKNEKKQLEASLTGELGRINSSASGYFSVNVDGWEELFTPKALKEMTVDSFNELISAQVEKDDNAIGKICLDYYWYTLCPIDKSKAVDYTVGKMYKLEYPSTTNTVFDAKLEKMITQTDKEQVILVFSSNTIDEGFRYTRKQNVKIIKESLEGLRINKEALRIVNGVQGVYTISGNTVRFKKAEIIYTSDDYYLVRLLKSTDEDYKTSLMMYDNVIIGGKDLYDGKIIN